jgi:hypothetical protein
MAQYELFANFSFVFELGTYLLFIYTLEVK